MIRVHYYNGFDLRKKLSLMYFNLNLFFSPHLTEQDPGSSSQSGLSAINQLFSKSHYSQLKLNLLA